MIISTLLVKIVSIFIKKVEWKFQVQEKDKDPSGRVAGTGERMTEGCAVILNNFPGPQLT